MTIVEPPNGTYMLFGENPDEYVAVRHDAPDASRGQWFPLLARKTSPMDFEQVRRPPAAPGEPPRERPVPGVRLLTVEQAVQEMLLGPAQVAYQRYLVGMQASDVPATRKQLAQSAQAVRALAIDVATRFGVELPPWPSPGVAARERVVDAPTERIAVVAAPPVAVEDAVTAVVPVVAATSARACAAVPGLAAEAEAERTGGWWRTLARWGAPREQVGRSKGRHRAGGQRADDSGLAQVGGSG